jgi:predicted metal-dependent HD superfamily phosphohydrolase
VRLTCCADQIVCDPVFRSCVCGRTASPLAIVLPQHGTKVRSWDAFSAQEHAKVLTVVATAVLEPTVNVVPDQVFEDLNRRYAEPHRAYHNWTHIEELLAQFEANTATLNRPFAFKLAILFHDAIYDPRASDNETRSALLLESALNEAASAGDIMCAKDLILATHKHTTSAVDRRFVADAELFLDMDLSILGAGEERFDDYDAAIREEYSFVPLDTYRQRRAEILKSFLARPRLYLTDDYHHRLDGIARTNLRRAIGRLECEIPR